MNMIYETIPQREPFLFVDEVIEIGEKQIHTQKKLTGEEDFFKGHFPGNPVMPGVLMCECCFQAGAVFMGQKLGGSGLGVVTRIKDARFKNMARPGDTLDIKVELEEQVANVCYMKAKVSVGTKTIMQIKFQVASIEE